MGIEVQILVLISIIVGSSIQQVFKKAYNNRGGRSIYIFCALTVAAAAIFFAATADYPLSFTWDFVPYSVGFAAGYLCATIFTMLAIKEGSLSLTSLAISFSLLIPTVFGLIVYDEPLNPWFFIGLGLLLTSIVLINTEGGEIKITFKWLIFVLLAFVGNGACSTVQNGYAKIYSTGSSEFMIVALSIVFAFLMLFAFLFEAPAIVPTVKKHWYLALLCGAANGATNFCVILLSPHMPASIMYPLVSAGCIVLTSLVSIFIYRERLSPLQYAGMIFGIGAIVFLNL
jgi:drug/metabolite transporter (DMT)-like permease